MTFNEFKKAFSNLNFFVTTSMIANDGANYNGGANLSFILGTEADFLAFVNESISSFAPFQVSDTADYISIINPNTAFPSSIFITEISTGNRVEIYYNKSEAVYRIKAENGYIKHFTRDGFQAVYEPKIYNQQNSYELIGHNAKSYVFEKGEVMILDNEVITLTDDETIFNTLSAKVQESFFFEQSKVEYNFSQPQLVGQATRVRILEPLLSQLSQYAITIPNADFIQGEVYQIDIFPNRTFETLNSNAIYLSGAEYDELFQSNPVYTDTVSDITITGTYNVDVLFSNSNQVTVNAIGDTLIFQGLTTPFVVGERYILKDIEDFRLLVLEGEELEAISADALTTDLLRNTNFTVDEDFDLYQSQLYSSVLQNITIPATGQVAEQAVIHIEGLTLKNGALYAIDTQLSPLYQNGERSYLMGTHVASQNGEPEQNYLTLGADLIQTFLDAQIVNLDINQPTDIYKINLL